MAAENSLEAGRRRPDASRLVPTGRGERFAIRRKQNVRNPGRVAPKNLDWLHSLSIPDTHQAILASREQQFVVRRKGHRLDRLAVSSNPMDGVSLQIPESYRAIVRCCREQAIAGGKGNVPEFHGSVVQHLRYGLSRIPQP